MHEVCGGIIALMCKSVLHRPVLKCCESSWCAWGETKGTVTLPKLTSAMLQTAGLPVFPPLKSAFKTLKQRTRWWLAKFPEIVLSGMDTENIIVLMLTFPQGSGEKETERDSRRNAALIGKGKVCLGLYTFI